MAPLGEGMDVFEAGVLQVVDQFFGNVVAAGVEVAKGDDVKGLLHVDAVTLHGFDHVIDGHKGGHTATGDGVTAIAPVKIFHDGDKTVFFSGQDDMGIVETKFPGISVPVAEVEVGIGKEPFANHKGELTAHEVVHIAPQGMVLGEFFLDEVPHAPDKALFFVEIRRLASLNLGVKLPDEIAHEQGLFDAFGGAVAKVGADFFEGHVHDGFWERNDAQLVQDFLAVVGTQAKVGIGGEHLGVLVQQIVEAVTRQVFEFVLRNIFRFDAFGFEPLFEKVTGMPAGKFFKHIWLGMHGIFGQPVVNDGFGEAQKIADLGIGHGFFMDFLVNGGGGEIQVSGHFFDGHDFLGHRMPRFLSDYTCFRRIQTRRVSHSILSSKQEDTQQWGRQKGGKKGRSMRRAARRVGNAKDVPQFRFARGKAAHKYGVEGIAWAKKQREPTPKERLTPAQVAALA